MKNLVFKFLVIFIHIPFVYRITIIINYFKDYFYLI